jgi:branched-chain amino acid transport system permease protein
VWRPPPDPQWPVTPRTFLAALAAGTLGLCLLPRALSPYHLIVFSYALVLAIACLGLNLLLGHTGLLSFGHAAFFGMGAYTGGFIYSFAELRSLELYLLSGIAAAAALAALVGLLCVQSTRIHFTILTLAFAQVVHSLFIAGTVFRLAGGQGRGLFLLGGGGLYIPRFTIAGFAVEPEDFQAALYYVIVAAFVLSTLLMWWIVNTPFGKTLHAIRDNEVRAESIGIRIRRYRWVAFLISGVFAGLAGGLFGQLDRQVTPEQLHWVFSAKLVLATVLGGHRHLLGPAVGAVVLAEIQEFALRFTQYHGLVLGALLIAVVLTFPGGLCGYAVAATGKVLARTRRQRHV